MNYEKLAALLFPDVRLTAEDYEKKYPPRDLPAGAMVTRLGPSPTGFIHLGNLYGAFVDERLAHLSGGVFYLRIEDTDDRRYVEGAVETLIQALDYFAIHFDEGRTEEGEKGDYGPYTQSLRQPIYRCYAKKLVSEGKAYPCFLTEEEIGNIRIRQEKNKETPGIYGPYALCRSLTLEEIEKKIKGKETYVIRLKSDGKASEVKESRFQIEDEIRGILDMPRNFQDVVLLKANGVPTYHFAHVIDDHLMRTTHVVRGEEWLSSLPIHVEFFEKLGWEPPVYCHTAQLMKLGENGHKRKLSKRHDPELSLRYYQDKGYHPVAVREYLMTILNSDYEEWRAKNPQADLDGFDFRPEKMSAAGALFDIDKLNDISKDVLLRIPADKLYLFIRKWAETCAPEYQDMLADAPYVRAILDIGRKDKKPRKDLVFGRQIMDYFAYFFEPLFQRTDPYPPEVSSDDIPKILRAYLASYEQSDAQDQWFQKIREIATAYGYAAKPKDYKKEPEKYKGHVGHVSTVIRIALTGRATSPDIWTIQQILGEARTKERIEGALACGTEALSEGTGALAEGMRGGEGA